MSYMIDFLRKEFDESCKKLNHSETLTVETFEFLVNCYNDPRRYYHNLDHIYNCVSMADAIPGTLIDRAKVKLALFFHDIVYDVSSKTNEHISSFLANKFLDNIYIHDVDLTEICNIIKLTQYHTQNLEGLSPLEKYALDIDLSGLGADWEIYTENSDNIVKEYLQIYSLAEIYVGRAKFLATMINKPRIYMSKYFHSRYEIKANFNMKKELEVVKSLQFWQAGR